MKNSNIKFVAPVIVLFLIVFYALFYSGLLIGFQVIYYKSYFNLTKVEDNPKILKDLHQATMVKRDGVETYAYTPEDRIIIQSDSAKCIACHGKMTEKNKRNKPKYPIHDKMINDPMMSFQCTHCHKQVDTRKRRPGRATITVERELCPKCHNSPLVTQGGLTGGPLAGAPAIPPQLPQLLVQHGSDAESGKKWIATHPRVAMALGIQQCRKCHIYGSELDFCNDCHLRGGFRPDSHKVLYSVPLKTVYPDSKKTAVVKTRWKGYHTVLVKDALKKLGTNVDSPQNLPMDTIAKLPCGACHILEDWCTRCHIKHNSNWLDPVKGHPDYVNKYGTSYCFKCHDPEGTKCVSCHTYVGKIN